MGMAASQARLLTLTARIHDIEYQAQAIQNAKLQLATQSDDAYSEYLNELDATTLAVNSFNPYTAVGGLVSATFNNLCSINKLYSANGKNYALQNKNGKLIVSDDIYEGYNTFRGLAGFSTAYQFAMYMLGDLQDNSSPEALIGTFNPATGFCDGPEDTVYQNLINSPDIKEEDKERLQNLRQRILDCLSTDTYQESDIYNANASMDSQKRKEYMELLNAYHKLLYELGGEDIALQAGGIPTYDQEKFTYYVSIYNQIQAAGGCVPISDYDGPEGDAANDSEWLQAMVQAGLISIHMIETNKDSGYVSFSGTSPSSDSSLQFVQTTDIDKTALKKAEAKYEKALKDIDKKDKRFDMDLAKLETERSALTTEYDQVKKIAQENIDRTFKIFS